MKNRLTINIKSSIIIPVGLVHADVAQLAEQLICNQQVGGSSPSIGLVYTPEDSIYAVPGFFIGKY